MLGSLTDRLCFCRVFLLFAVCIWVRHIQCQFPTTPDGLPINPLGLLYIHDVSGTRFSKVKLYLQLQAGTFYGLSPPVCMRIQVYTKTPAIASVIVSQLLRLGAGKTDRFWLGFLPWGQLPPTAQPPSPTKPEPAIAQDYFLPGQSQPVSHISSFRG